MSPTRAIWDSIQSPLQYTQARTEPSTFPVIAPLGKGRLLSVEQSARLAMMGKEDRDAAVQAILQTYF